MTFDHTEREQHWQQVWDENNAFQATEQAEDKKYVLGMFPYPSGDLHMGHIRNYTITDAVARYYRSRGKDVIHPFGWDAFGLPAENAAEERNTNPRDWTDKCIAEMKADLSRMGFGYDWEREIQTSDPSYYKWNQWIFTKLYDEGLVDYRNAAVNWCPSCQTALADAQVEDECCWRCDTPITEKDKRQWFIKITEYADELQDSIEQLDDWPEAIKEQQRNWIGRTEGHEIVFEEVNAPEDITVFTTRADTIEGATYVAISPEHAVAQDVTVAIDENSDDTTVGQETEFTVRNPVTEEELPVFVAPYVEDEVGTGAVMGVPAHDNRDFVFARAHEIEVRQVVGENPPPVTEEVPMTDGQFEGRSPAAARRGYEEEYSQVQQATTYHLHDWLISRQRYWGTPIPIVHCDDCGPVTVPESQFPIELPQYEQKRGNPLECSTSWKETACPSCGADAVRETDTMDTFVDSSWYFLRYLSPDEETVPVRKADASSWMPVDEYVGGSEHAVTHLLYARFINRFLEDIGILEQEEPFDSLTTQGMVRLDGEKMSKSKGNVVSPSEIVDAYGADTARWFMMSAAAPKNDFDWKDDAVESSYEFLQKIDTLINENISKSENRGVTEYDQFIERVATWVMNEASTAYEETSLHKIDPLCRQLVRWVRWYTRIDSPRASTLDHVVRVIASVVSPIAPHAAEEYYSYVEDDPVATNRSWPTTRNDIPQMDVVKDFFEDVKSVVDATDVHGTLHVTVGPEWKYAMTETVKDAKREELLSEVMSKEKFRSHGDEAAAYAEKLREGMIPNISRSEEKELYEQLSEYVVERYDSVEDVVVHSESPDSQDDHSAEPRRPTLSLV